MAPRLASSLTFFFLSWAENPWFKFMIIDFSCSRRLSQFRVEILESKPLRSKESFLVRSRIVDFAPCRF